MAGRITRLTGAVRELGRNRITVVFVAIAAAYWLGVALIPSRYPIEIASATLVGVALVIVMTYAPAAIRMVRTGDSGGVSQWLVGIVFFFGATAASSIWSLAWRWTGYPDWMTFSPWLGFIRLSQVVGAAMLITSPGAESRSIPPQNWRWLVAAVGIGGLIVGATIGSIFGTIEMLPR